MNPRIKFHNLIRQLLPVHLRQPIRLWLLGMLIDPIRLLFESFDSWRDDIRLRLNLNSQVKLLEGYLNAKYDPSKNIRIIGFDDGLLPIGLRFKEDNYLVPLGFRSQESTLDVPLRGEMRSSLGDVDFIVYIPYGVDTDKIAAEVETYKQAGVKYKIIQNKEL